MASQENRVEVISYLCESLDIFEIVKNLKNLLVFTTGICGIKGPSGLSSDLLSRRDVLVNMNYVSYTDNGFEIITFYNKYQFVLSCALYFTVDNIHATVSFFDILEGPGKKNIILSVRILNVYFTPEYQPTDATQEQFEKKLDESLRAKKAMSVNIKGNIIYNSDNQLPYNVEIPDRFLIPDCPMIIICNGKYTTHYSSILGINVNYPNSTNNYHSNNSIILFSPIFKEKNGRYENSYANSSCVSLSFTEEKPAKQSLFSRAANYIKLSLIHISEPTRPY